MWCLLYDYTMSWHRGDHVATFELIAVLKCEGEWSVMMLVPCTMAG